MILRSYLIGAVIAGLLQTGALAKMIFDRNTLLRNGTEVQLETGFVDPRDMFRGHYVTLNLLISRIEKTSISGPAQDPSYNDPVWVALVPRADGFWQADALYTTLPENIDQPVIKGKLRYSNSKDYLISFPVDRYFAPKKRALELEQFRRDQALGVILALDGQGNASVKGITVEGKRIYDEPLF